MTRTTVSFDSAGIEIAAHLYVPDQAGSDPSPALVVGHPGTGVKEQASGTYAQLMAERGFVALAFDAAYQGESGGVPRGLEDPAQRVEDFKAAVSYLSTRAEVDANRIGLLGVCASGGYSLAATAGDHRVKAVGTVCTAEPARQFRFGADGTQNPAVFQNLLAAAARARTTAALGQDPGTMTMFPQTAEQAGELGGQHGIEGFEYYCTSRGEHERSAKFLTWDSIDKMASSDVFYAIPLIGPRPILQIIGERAVTAWMGIEAHKRATGPSEIHWIGGASHVDLYDKLEYIVPAVDKLAQFFTTALTTIW
ncbi:alpha/beta hydrolase [Nocardia noduli]|uniref:alpha/beta hydrolase n=1 Tax=Nocardia noduli TaxID=2815722 RepID=UPI001C21A1B7|nr:alpha/beta hydrolase [Nocardia noduli]